MCLRSAPPPVFLDLGGARTPFLDDLFGRSLADRFRTLVGQPPLHANSDPRFGFVDCPPGPDSYLAHAFSSPLAYAVVLLAIGAGLLLLFRRKTAVAALGISLILSLADTALRLGWSITEGNRDLMLAGLPMQLVSNFMFQILLPCLLIFGLAWVGTSLRKMVGLLFRRS